MKHSLASASTVAHVMYQKYVNALPFYRQEKDLEQYGVKIGRATLANWIIRCSTDGITRCGCWSHLRRYFVESMPPGSEKALQLSNGEIGRDYCNQLFSMEKQFTLLNPELRKQQRLEQEIPVLEAFWSWVTSLNPLKGSKLAKAVTYAKNQRTYLENYLLDGRCALSNNLQKIVFVLLP